MRPLIAVEFVFEEGQWVAADSYTGMFGEGDTRADAFADYIRGLADLRSELASYRDHLSAELADQLAAIEAMPPFLDLEADR